MMLNWNSVRAWAILTSGYDLFSKLDIYSLGLVTIKSNVPFRISLALSIA